MAAQQAERCHRLQLGRVIFLPTAYAKSLTYPKYSSKLKNKAVRGWVDSHMY